MTALLLIAALLTQAPAAASTGANKQVAQGAIAAARAAIEQSKTTDKRDAANAQLKAAQALFVAEKYPEAAKAADAAWQLVSLANEGPTRFAVEVAESGKTTVTSTSGRPVRVEAEGVSQPLYAGQLVSVEKGEKPAEVVTPSAATTLGAPELVSPKVNERLKFKASQKLLGPVALSWKAVQKARRYEVEVWAVEGVNQKPLLLMVEKTKAKLPPLPSGKYTFAVRALGADGLAGGRSEERTFELLRDNVKIEIENTKWK